MNPRSVAIVGASQRKSRGTRVLDNLQGIGFDGPIYPINPRYDEIQGVRCYPSPGEVPGPIDSIVVAIPGAGVPGILKDAKDAGVKAAVVLSSGFREAGPEGLVRHQQLEDLARAGMPICGPNCYGVLNLATRAATFSGRIPEPARSGPLAFVSQSGGFTNMVVNPLVEDRGLGFKYMVSCGNQVGARIEDYLRYLVEDPDVSVIGCFVEGLSSVDALIEVGDRARELEKHIVMLKSGRSIVASEAVASHTGSIAGSAKVVDAVLRRAGIISVGSLDELAETLCLLAVGDPGRIGRRVLVVTGSGGESSHAADAAERAGVAMPRLSSDSAERLVSEVLPDFGNPRNPLDGTGAMFEDPNVFPGLMDVAVADDAFDVVAVNLGHRPPEGPWAPMREFAKNIASLPAEVRSRVVGYSSMAGGPVDSELMQTLLDAEVPLLLGSEYAMKAIARVADRNETPAENGRSSQPGAAAAWPSVENLGVQEMWSLLGAYGVPVVDLKVARSRDEAVEIAAEIGYPVALKIASFAVAHKSDLGGVELNVGSADETAEAYDNIHAVASSVLEDSEAAEVIVQAMAPPGHELLVGIIRDEAMGPAVVVGTGGVYVEFLDDGRVGIPPFDVSQAHAMLREMRGFPLLTGVRGNIGSDLEAVAKLLANVSRMAVDLPDSVRAVDLNPVIVHPEGLGASCVDVWIETLSDND